MLRLTQTLALAAILIGLAACSAPAGKGPFDHPAGLGIKGPDGAMDADVEEGRTLLEKGDYDGALAVLLKARKTYPDAPEIQYLLAEVHQATGQCLKASSHLAKVGTEGTLGEWAQVLAARWARGLADGTIRCAPRRKAAAAVSHLLTLSPDLGTDDLRDRLALLLTDRARDLEGSGRCRDALTLITRAEALGGASRDALLLRGRCLLRRGRHDEVIALATGCLERTPPAEDAVAALARRGEETFRHDSAISLWSLLKTSDAFADEATASLGRLLLKVKRPDEAAASLRAYVGRGATPEERLARAVEAAHQLGEFDRYADAVALLDEGLSERPDDLPGVRLRATLLWRSDQRAEAVSSLLDWMNRADDRVTAFEAALELLTDWEGWREGLKLLYRVRSEDGGYAAELAPLANLYTGLFRTRLGDDREATKAFTSYLGIEGHVGRARARVGALLFAAGDAKGALPWLEAAVGKKPRWPAAAPALASVYHALDRADRIPAVFQDFVKDSADKGVAWAEVARWWAGIGALDEALAASDAAMKLLEVPAPELLLLHGRLLLVRTEDPDLAYPLLEEAATKIDSAELVEIWRLVSQRDGRQASCVRAAILRRSEARIGANSDGRRALVLPATGLEGTFPLTLEAELDDLLGCGHGEVDARIDRYLDEARTDDDALAMATILVRALLEASFPDRVTALVKRFPAIPSQAARTELRLIDVLLERAPEIALARLSRLAGSPGLDPNYRLDGAEAFLASEAPKAAEVILGVHWEDFDDASRCRAHRILVETRLALGDAPGAMERGRAMASQCVSRAADLVHALDRLADLGPAEPAFELAVHLLDRLHEPSQVRRIVVAAVRAGRRAGMDLDTVGDHLAQASKGWKGEVEVAGVLAATGRYDAAAQLLEAARERNPREGATLKRVLMLHRMATLKGQVGQVDPALILEMCEQHLMANERSDESLLSLLGFLEGLGFSELAKDLADRHVPADTSNAGLLLLRASLAVGTGDADAAPTLLERGVMAAPNIKDFLDAATGLLERYGRHADAIRLLESALQIRPDLPAIAMDLAWRLSIAKDPDWNKVAGLIDGVVARVPAQLERGVRTLQGGTRYDLARPILRKLQGSADERAAWTATRLMLQHAAETGAHAEVDDIVATYTARKIPGFRLQSLSDLLFEHGYLKRGLALLEAHQGKDPNQAAGVLRALKLIQSGRVDEGMKLVDVFFEDLVLGHRKLTRSDRMTPELHKLFDSVNNFLWDMGLDAQAGSQLDRAIATYPDDPALLIRRCRSLLTDEKAPPEAAFKLFRVLLDVETEPASLKTRNIVHHLSARGLGVQATNLMLDAFDPARPRWWTPMLLELLVVQERPRVLRRVVEQLASHPGGSANLIGSAGVGLLARGQTELSELLLRQALLRTRQQDATTTGDPKADAFSQIGATSQPAPDTELSGRLMVFLVKAMAAAGAAPDAIHVSARGALRVHADGEGLSRETRVLLASALEEAEVWDPALAEWRLQQALAEGGAAPYLREFRIHLIRGDEAAAREALWRCVATTPGTTGLLTRFAEQARRVLALELSVELYGMAIRLDEVNTALAFSAAEPLLLLGRDAEARALLEWYAAESGPGSIRNQRLEAAALAYRYNRFALAGILMEGVDSAAGWLERSRNHLRAGDVEQGWREFEEAAKRAPNAALAARALLATLLKSPAPERKLIENLLAKAQTPKENPSVTRYWEGVLLLQRSRWEAAARSFVAGLEGTRARFGLGLSMVKQLLARGRVAEVEAFTRAAFAGFKATAVRTELAKAVAEALHSGQIPKEQVAAVADYGVRVARTALSSDPADTWILTQLAEVQFAAGNIEGAVKTYDKALQDLPGDSGMENNQAYLLALTGQQTDRGLALVRAAIRREPSHNIFYLDTLGWLQYGQGRLEEAEENIRAALVRADFSSPGGLAEALYHLGIVQRDLGRLDDAKAALHRASVNDPFGIYGERARAELVKLGVDPYHRK